MATPENLETFFRASTEYGQQNKSLIQGVWAEQRQKEIEIINSADSLCPLRQLENLTIRSENIEKALEEGYGDAKILQSLMCLNNSLAVYPSMAELKQNYKVRNYIRKLRQIGSESVAGYAMASTIKSNNPYIQSDSDEPFVIKAPRQLNENSDLDMIHEYFVGAYGTNNLRSMIPNFAYVMGLFKCSPPYLDSKRVLTFCQNSDPEKQVTYLLYENIKNSVTLKKFIMDGCSLEDYLSVLTQVILSLALAYRQFRYEHGDLHNENVLVEKLPEEIYIAYVTDTRGTVKYLKTRYLARIIDLGRSFIQYNNEPFGYALYEGGVYPDRSYPMYDVYKILMFSLMTAAFGDRPMEQYQGLMDNEVHLLNPSVFNEIKEYLYYFDPSILRGPDGKFNRVVDYLIRTRKFYYSLLYDEHFDLQPLEFYESVMVPISGDHLFARAPVDQNKIYGCSEKGVCYTLQQAINKYSELDLNLLDDPYVFYEVFYEAAEKGSPELQGIVAQGADRFNDYVNHLRKDTQRYFDEYIKIINQLTIYSLVTPGRENITFQDQYLQKYRDYLANVVRAVDLQTSIYGNIKILHLLFETYPYLSQEVENTVEMELRRYQTISPILDQAIQSINQDMAYINQIGGLSGILRFNPRAGWLFNQLLSVYYSIRV